MSTVKKIEDPELGEFFRATCEICGKTFESLTERGVLYVYVRHRGMHNGHER